mmetsp:Transcript_22730/g.48264  ORF Transcript_22730/g.48264 Transcript_22730/m.48264 type:complete len:267 (+) Transcript_22730:83-883(+)
MYLWLSFSPSMRVSFAHGSCPHTRVPQLHHHPLPDELLDEILSQSHFFVVFLGELQLGKDVFGTYHFSVRVAIQQAAGHVKEGNHFVHPLRDHQRVDLPRWLKDVAPGLGDPVVFQVRPFPLEDVAVHGTRVAVPRQEARTADPQQVYVVTGRDAETQRAEGHRVRLRDPELFLVDVVSEAVVAEGVREDLRDEDLAQGLLGLLAPIRGKGVVRFVGGLSLILVRFDRNFVERRRIVSMDRWKDRCRLGGCDETSHRRRRNYHQQQ